MRVGVGRAPAWHNIDAVGSLLVSISLCERYNLLRRLAQMDGWTFVCVDCIASASKLTVGADNGRRRQLREPPQWLG